MIPSEFFKDCKIDKFEGEEKQIWPKLKDKNCDAFLYYESGGFVQHAFVVFEDKIYMLAYHKWNNILWIDYIPEDNLSFIFRPLKRKGVIYKNDGMREYVVANSI